MQNKLLNLLKANASGAASIRIEQSDKAANLYLYDVIDPMFGASASQMIEALAANAGKAINLHINSPGGDVFESLAMASALAAHDGKVTAFITGIAASAATRVALAASEVRIADGGMFMIHNSWSLGFGNKEELRQTADLLEKIDGTIANDYAKKTGKEASVIIEMMAAETWMTAQEALDHGFVDAIDSISQNGKQNIAKWDLSAYEHAPIVATIEPENNLDAARLKNERRLRLLQIT